MDQVLEKKKTKKPIQDQTRGDPLYVKHNANFSTERSNSH